MQRTIIEVSHDPVHFIKTQVSKEEGEGVWITFTENFFGKWLSAHPVTIKPDADGWTDYFSAVLNPSFPRTFYDDITTPIGDGSYPHQNLLSYWIALDRMLQVLNRSGTPYKDWIIADLIKNKPWVDFDFKVTPKLISEFSYATVITGHRTYANGALILEGTSDRNKVRLGFKLNVIEES